MTKLEQSVGKAALVIERENMMESLVEFGSADTRYVMLEEHFVF